MDVIITAIFAASLFILYALVNWCGVQITAED